MDRFYRMSFLVACPGKNIFVISVQRSKHCLNGFFLLLFVLNLGLLGIDATEGQRRWK